MLIILQLLDLVKKAQDGDKLSLKAIIKNFEGFMYKTASSIYINGYEIEDLIQIEAIALINAVFKYNCEYKMLLQPTPLLLLKMLHAMNLEVI